MRMWAKKQKISNLGYRMPAEWEKHESTWLAWPYDKTTFPKIEKAEKIYIKIIGTLFEGEKINLLVKDGAMKAKVKKLLNRKGIELKKINFKVFDYADVWIRDYGPIFLVNKKGGRLAMVHWIFNAWGEKYEELKKDTQIPELINKEMKLMCFNPGIVLEGGSIEVNGKGTLLTTKQCLLNKNRNPGLNKKAIEKYLKEYLGVKNIIWLKNGIVGDDTDGHIDDIARFVNPTTVLCSYEENKEDENYPVLKENYEILKKLKDQDGKRLNVIKLPMPGFLGNKQRLPASYANFYIANKTVFVPIFGQKNDKKALNIIQEVFPNKKAVGINCTKLVEGLGAIHCITQQQPSLDLRKN